MTNPARKRAVSGVEIPELGHEEVQELNDEATAGVRGGIKLENVQITSYQLGVVPSPMQKVQPVSLKP